ncbi:aryl-sulfate sulfotransferase [Fulvimarina endophytica]|uniref:Aryl-sulfate sulfotransferase n=1 Tax=Fulvimarina endophytica TaxID=2293836 RepID=A0A371X074_9HYPH|nr:ribbon-helix-helix domain-containing protein [Fulvimarina endophytica]RFC62619.1 aryl-sulfate sulfotransferase [Fulvimarina endophytica]
MTVKRSLSIRGHRTSITLEEPFWRHLGHLAEERGTSVASLVAEMDAARDPDVNLSSAIRVALFETVLSRLDEVAGSRADPNA